MDYNGAEVADLKKTTKSHKIFDLAVAWNWEYDRDFVSQINNTALESKLKPYLVYPSNLNETLGLLRKGLVKFSSFFDRASDTDYRFLELVRLLQQNRTYFVDHPDRAKWIDDKVLLHMEFTINKISVPPTFIYYPTDEWNAVMNKIRHLGTPFVVKPAHTVNTGELEVLMNACSVEDVFRWHSRHKDFIFLLQKQITPCLMNKRPAWFRIFYVFGKIIPCWWDPSTHIYEVVTGNEVNKFRLTPLYDIIKKIGKIYRLGFFSTEIAVEKGRRFIVIDYVNDQCDMRKKSKFIDGVCDEIVDLIVNEIVGNLQKCIAKPLFSGHKA